MNAVADIAGRRYGKWIVLAHGERHGWLCRCDCGTERTITASSLNSGKTKSCGCARSEHVTKGKVRHGEAVHGKRTPEYRIWRAMTERCRNPNHHAFKNYGGRGIKVCERWVSSFENFLADMGRRPSPEHSIDRYPDKNGNYEPDNCRWATWIEQNNNRRSPKSRREGASHDCCC